MIGCCPVFVLPVCAAAGTVAVRGVTCQAPPAAQVSPAGTASAASGTPAAPSQYLQHAKENSLLTALLDYDLFTESMIKVTIS